MPPRSTTQTMECDTEGCLNKATFVAPMYINSAYPVTWACAEHARDELTKGWKSINRINQEEPMVAKDAQSKPPITVTLLATAQQEAHDAVWLTAGKQAAKRTRDVATSLLTKHVGASLAKRVAVALNTEVGLAVYAIGLGSLMATIPQATATPGRAKLASAMRVWGLHVISDGIADPVLDAFLAAFDDVLTKIGTTATAQREP
jgi:hypothetical protein